MAEPDPQMAAGCRNPTGAEAVGTVRQTRTEGPTDMEVLIPLLAVFSIFFIPIASLMLILTTKFAFKPLVETLAKALRESGQGAQDTPHWELQELTEQVLALTEEVRQLKEVQEFDKKLLGSEASSVR